MDKGGLQAVLAQLPGPGRSNSEALIADGTLDEEGANPFNDPEP